jgi:hypothetical protein
MTEVCKGLFRRVLYASDAICGQAMGQIGRFTWYIFSYGNLMGMIWVGR